VEQFLVETWVPGCLPGFGTDNQCPQSGFQGTAWALGLTGLSYVGE
jgi:hypothetical protein